MTLIAALRCRDGLILGSDSQETRGIKGRRLARPTQKVYVPRPGFLLAWAGPQDVAQGFILRLVRAKGLSPHADRLEIKARIHAILAELREDSSIEERSDHVELLIAWFSQAEKKPVALHIFSGGAGEWVGPWAFGGVRLAVESASFAISGAPPRPAHADPRAGQDCGAEGAARHDRNRRGGHRRARSDGHDPKARPPTRGGG